MPLFLKREKPLLFLIVFLIVLNFFVWQEVFDSLDERLEVVFFDVGQGDSIFIETSQNHQILIDGGPGIGLTEKLEKEMAFWDKTVDLVILTHPEKDHIKGLIEVLKRYKVDNILWTGIVRRTDQYREWERILKEQEFNVVIAKAGQKIEAGDVYIDILHPFKNLEGKEIKNSNDTSIIARMVFGTNSFLFTGDITSEIETELINKGVVLNSNILKVSHHGSKYSSDKTFLGEVAPEAAVIQTGKNPYGHPAEEVLQKLKKFGIYVLRTDKLGNIKIFSDGNNLNLKIQRAITKNKNIW